MSTSETLQILAPIIQPLILFAASMLALVLSGGLKRIQTWMNAHDMAAAASAVADANAAIQPALTTAATAIVEQVQAGTLPTDQAAWSAALAHELGLVKQRVPGMLAIAQPLESALLASMAKKASAMLIAAPVAPSAAPVVAASAPLDATASIKAAVQTINDARSALASADAGVKMAPVSVLPSAPIPAAAAPVPAPVVPPAIT